MVERPQLILSLCKVETRSAVDNMLIIRRELASTLHNDMLVIKKQLNFPAVSVKFSYRDGLQTKVIGHKVIQSTIREILVGHDTKHLRIFLRSIEPVKRNEFIFKYSGTLINFKVLHNGMPEIIFRSCDEECILGSDLLIKPIEISIAFIHNALRTRLYRHRIQYIHVMYGTYSDIYVDWNRTS